MTGATQPDPGDAASWFRWFAQNSYGDSSPIYRKIVAAIADEDALLDVVRGIDERHPPKTDETDISKVGIVWFPGDGTSEQRQFVGWSHNHGSWLDWPLDADSQSS